MKLTKLNKSKRRKIKTYIEIYQRGKSIYFEGYDGDFLIREYDMNNNKLYFEKWL